MKIKENLFFRVDFKREKRLSYGHFFRCIDFISHLNLRKFNIFFLSLKYDQKLLSKYKFINLIKLNNYKKILNYSKPNFLIIDLPFKDKKILNYFDDRTKTIVIGDNFIPYKKMDYFLSPYVQNVKKKIKSYTGSEFFIVNKFKKLKKIKFRKNIKKILISFGGSDPKNYTLKLIKKIKFNKNYDYYFILGPGNPNKLKNRENINFINAPNKIKFNKLRSECDVSIVSGGITMFENLKCNLPSLVIPTTLQEKKNSEKLVRQKLIIMLKKFTSKNINEQLEFLIKKKRSSIYKKLVKFNENKILLSKIIKKILK